VLSDSSHAIDHGSSRAGRWLAARRYRIVLWIAAIECLIVLVSDITKWTVIALAIVGLLAWFAGRESKSQTVREVLWIFAASQCLAAIGAVLGFLVKWAVITLVIIFAVLGLAYLFLDRR
jgi:uncharacterized membrane protein YphA (DoxX/SURF4 family)